MVYQVTILPSALRALQRLDRPARERILAKIAHLSDNPRPAQSKLLKVGEPYYRLRVGDYRVIYKIDDEFLVVLVVRIGHRKEIYRRR
ncbi:MAG: plasmid stabilization protein [Deltaproteobacteria bacterium RBG_13_61_14]|nr:MAG: plasmid stabilization protein [Deltaproteobacteria bacterium RBG_13_61_14]